MRTVIGIDAGGTKTAGLLADEHGTVIRSARAGGANLRMHGELSVEKALYQVLDALLGESPAAPGQSLQVDPAGPGQPLQIDALCLGIAGVGTEAERELVHGVLRRLGIRRPIRIENDALVALVAGAPDGVGVVLILSLIHI